MRIGIDATAWADRGGIGRFTRNAVASLVEVDPGNDYVLYVGSEALVRNGLPKQADKRLLTPAHLLRGMDLSRDDLDALVFPCVDSYFPVAGVPTVVGVHAVPARRRLVRSLTESLAVKRAARVFTVSVASRAAVASRYGIPTSRLAVVPEAADPVFRPSPRHGLGVVERLGLEPGRFLVYAGGFGPHKDVETLLRAHARLCTHNGSSPKLVLAGELLGADSETVGNIRRVIGELGSGDHVRLAGFVPDDQLAALYSACGAVAVPSLAEGFALPGVEAAACGAPVALSELPVHREALDGGALFFKPGDVDALADRLERLLGDSQLRREVSAEGLERAGKLSWRAAGERLRTLVAEAVRA
jgi:glycosyltransferase involved in cell wall biosynthesis